MDVAVVVPWRPGDPTRTLAWDWVAARYHQHHPDWQIVTGEHSDGPWSKALAVHDALQHTDADILIVADADCWTEGLAPAVDAVTLGHPWARPHENVHRLTHDATLELMAGGLPGACEVHPYRGVDGGGIAVIPRATYEQIPLDPRFAGWGGEDVSWGIALHVLAGRPYGVSAPLIHLWHQPQPDASPRRGPGGARHMNQPNQALQERYKHHRQDPAAMRDLIEEAREVLRGRQGDPEPAGHRRPAPLP